MDKIGVTFEYKKNKYTGFLDGVCGAGSGHVWHLRIDGYYCGRLRFTDKWVFDSTPKLDLSEFADFFGTCVTRAAQ